MSRFVNHSTGDLVKRRSYNVKALGRRAAGFTLLEMLVVLLITSLVTTLLIEGYTQLLDIRTRVAIKTSEYKRGELQWYWFTSVISGVVPTSHEKPEFFRGEADRVEAITVSPLFGLSGVPTQVSFRLETDDRGVSILHYSEDTAEEIVLADLGRGDARFSFHDRQHEVHDAWPVDPEGARLPALIQLSKPEQDDAGVWFANIPVSPQPRTDMLRLVD